MATRNMAYDHPAYTAVHGWGGSLLAGAAAVSQRFIAHANLQLKAINFTTVTVGTGAATDAKTLFIIRAGTSTETTALFTTTAAIYSTNLTNTNTLARGDVVYFSKGTDATEVGAIGIEYVIVPGANVTV